MSRGRAGEGAPMPTKATNPEFCLPGKGSPVTYLCHLVICLWQGFVCMNTENVEINSSPCPRVDNMDKDSRLLKAKTFKNT